MLCGSLMVVTEGKPPLVLKTQTAWKSGVHARENGVDLALEPMCEAALATSTER